MFKGILLASIITGSTIFANECPSDANPSIWRSAYHSDWELAHKQYLCWETSSLDDAVMKQFFIAYAQYKAGDSEAANTVFQRVDEMIKGDIFSDESIPLQK